MRGIVATLLLVVALAMFADGAQAQSQCQLFGTCAPKPPDDGPKPSKCDLEWRSARSADQEHGYRSFVSHCRRHPRAGSALARADELARLASAASERRRNCEARLSSLLGNEEYESVASFDQFSSQCPVTAQNSGPLRTRLAAKAKLEGELARWGLTRLELCTLQPTELLEKSRFKARTDEMVKAANSGDDTARLLFGFDWLSGFYETGEPLKTAQDYIVGAAQRGNPRAMAASAWLLLNRPEPNVAAADDYLKHARELKCGQASYLLGNRLLPTFGPTPDWAKGMTREAAYDEAIARGNGLAACMRVNIGGSQMPIAQRQTFIAKAKELKSRCADILEIAQGNPELNGANVFGPCAVDYLNCARNRYAALVAERVFGVGKALADIQANAIVKKNFYTNTYQYNANLLADAKLGNDDAMFSLGAEALTGFFGDTVNPQSGQTWCDRAWQLGNEYGAACLGLYAKNDRTLIDTSFKKDSCAPYDVALWAMPYFEANTTPQQMRQKIQAMPADRKARLTTWLPNLRYSFQISAGGGGACAPVAKWFNDNGNTLFQLPL